MLPVQRFKANFAPKEMADAADDNLTGYAVDGTELHDTDGHVRNLCLVWEDGRRAFFNYAYLVSGDLVLTDSLNIMLLDFSGQIVTLKGYRLDLLFDLLLNHSPKTVTATNPRYVSDDKPSATLVIEIIVNSD